MYQGKSPIIKIVGGIIYLIPGITSSKESSLLDIAASLCAFTGMSDISDIRTGECSERGVQALLSIADMAGQKDFIITLDIKTCANEDLTIKFRNNNNTKGGDDIFDRNLPDLKDIPFKHIESEPKLTLGLFGLLKLHWNIMKYLGSINATHYVFVFCGKSYIIEELRRLRSTPLLPSTCLIRMAEEPTSPYSDKAAQDL